jgi:hypothetical protein
VFCLFVFDREILDGLPRADRRVEFIWHSLVELDAALEALALPHGVPGAGLMVLHDTARSAVVQQALALGVQAVFTNHDDEPQALARDAEVAAGLSAQGVGFHSFKDHVVFERSELLTQAGKPYGVFTPYKNAWLKKVDSYYLQAHAVAPHAGALAAVNNDLRGKELLVDLDLVLDELLVEHVNQDVASDVGRVDRTRRASSAERALRELAIGSAREDRAHVVPDDVVSECSAKLNDMQADMLHQSTDKRHCLEVIKTGQAVDGLHH